jgi:hypothetical protein
VQQIQVIAIVALIIGYAVLSHYSASSPDKKGLGAALSIGPVLLIGVVLLWRWTRRLTALLVAVSCARFFMPTAGRREELRMGGSRAAMRCV